jgi:hypothetical protein
MTEALADSCSQGLHTDRANGPQNQFQTPEEITTGDTIMTHSFKPVIGQRVRYARKIVESDGETVRLGQIGTVIEVRDNTPADVVFGPVTVVVHIDGDPAPGELRHEAVFRPEELEPLRKDDDVQPDDAAAVEYLTGTAPVDDDPDDDHGHGFSSDEPHTCRWPDPHDGPHICEECGVTWPQTPADDDKGVRTLHTPKLEIHHAWGEVGTVAVWLAAREVPEVFDALGAVMALSPTAVAAALRKVAAVLDPEVTA